MALLLLAWPALAGAQASASDGVADEREALVIGYLRDCQGTQRYGRGHPCVAYADELYRDGPEVLGSRVAWLLAAGLFQGIADASSDPILQASASRRSDGIYRQVLESFPIDAFALSRLARQRTSRDDRIEAYEEIVRLHPRDHLAWWSLAHQLAPGDGPSPSRRALEAASRAWQLAKPLNFGFKFQYAGAYIKLLGAIEGDEFGVAALAQIREDCGVQAALHALRGGPDTSLGARLHAAAKVRVVYCESAYRYFDPIPCLQAEGELERMVAAQPRSFDALLELARLLEILYPVPGFGDPDEGCGPWTRSVREQRLQDVFERMLDTRPASLEARWRRAARICHPVHRLGAMEALARTTEDLPTDFRLALAREFLDADRPADAVPQAEQVLGQSPAEARYDAWALLVDALVAQRDWRHAARLLIAEGFPENRFRPSPIDPVPNGPSCE